MENLADQANLKAKIERILAKEIKELTLKGRGDCNYAYYVETRDGGKYIVKQERARKETEDQNDLIVEGNVIRQLYDTKLSIPVPHVVFVSENPKLYGYEYIEGELLRGIWSSLSEEEKINICRALGRFHAEIGMKFSKEMSKASGIDINESTGLHPKVEEQYYELIATADVPETFKDLAKKAKTIFDGTTGDTVFQFLHNDGHHENIIIKDKQISGVIDFGDAEWGETAKEFSRYIRDFPEHFEHIVSSYEEVSGNKLSRARLVSNSMLSDFIDIIEKHKKGGEGKAKAEKAIAIYGKLIESL